MSKQLLAAALLASFTAVAQADEAACMEQFSDTFSSLARYDSRENTEDSYGTVFKGYVDRSFNSDGPDDAIVYGYKFDREEFCFLNSGESGQLIESVCNPVALASEGFKQNYCKAQTKAGFSLLLK